jgi:hypothetical protein
MEERKDLESVGGPTAEVTMCVGTGQLQSSSSVSWGFLRPMFPQKGQWPRKTTHAPHHSLKVAEDDFLQQVWSGGSDLPRL